MSAELQKNIKDLETTINMVVNHVRRKAMCEDFTFSKRTKALTIQFMCQDINVMSAQYIQHQETLKSKTDANN